MSIRCSTSSWLFMFLTITLTFLNNSFCHNVASKFWNFLTKTYTGIVLGLSNLVSYTRFLILAFLSFYYNLNHTNVYLPIKLFHFCFGGHS